MFVAPDENENSKGPFRPLRHSYDVKEPYHHSPVQTKELVREMEEVEKKATSSSEAAAAEAEADNEDEDVEEETEVSDNQVTLVSELSEYSNSITKLICVHFVVGGKACRI